MGILLLNERNYWIFLCCVLLSFYTWVMYEYGMHERLAYFWGGKGNEVERGSEQRTARRADPKWLSTGSHEEVEGLEINFLQVLHVLCSQGSWNPLWRPMSWTLSSLQAPVPTCAESGRLKPLLFHLCCCKTFHLSLAYLSLPLFWKIYPCCKVICFFSQMLLVHDFNFIPSPTTIFNFFLSKCFSFCQETCQIFYVCV